MDMPPTETANGHAAHLSVQAAKLKKLYSVYRLKITLLDTDPPIWRRIEVPGSMRLSKLHRCIQAAMGWQDYHLHEFRIGDRVYGFPDEEYYDPKHVTHPDHTVALEKVAPMAPAAFVYEYDFGDSWQHLILVEEITYTQERVRHAVCLAGERACPPEDCGGTGGYEDFLEAIADPYHEEHEAMLTWVGGSYDPSLFDLDAANRRLQRVR